MWIETYSVAMLYAGLKYVTSCTDVWIETFGTLDFNLVGNKSHPVRMCGLKHTVVL